MPVDKSKIGQFPKRPIKSFFDLEKSLENLGVKPLFSDEEIESIAKSITYEHRLNFDPEPTSHNIEKVRVIKRLSDGAYLHMTGFTMKYLDLVDLDLDWRKDVDTPQLLDVPISSDVQDSISFELHPEVMEFLMYENFIIETIYKITDD